MIIDQFHMDQYAEVYSLWSRVGIGVGPSDTFDQIQRVASRNEGFFLVGKNELENNRIIAVVMGAHDGRRGYIHHLAVDPAYQRKGYGTMLMNEACKRLSMAGLQKIHLFVENSTPGVIEFYQSLGWHIRNDLTMLSFIPDFPENN